MARINLLPWREELRERRNKEFITLVTMSVLLGLTLAFAAWSYFNNILTDQQSANTYITTENAKLDVQLKEIESLEQRREDIISRMQVIQDLQGKRPLPVRVWDDIANAIPQAMYLTEFRRQGDMLTFIGKADNPNVMSSFVSNLDDSDWLGDTKVNSWSNDVNAYDGPTTMDANSNYPEDSYISFEVTTQVSNRVATEEEIETQARAQQQLINSGGA